MFQNLNKLFKSVIYFYFLYKLNFEQAKNFKKPKILKKYFKKLKKTAPKFGKTRRKCNKQISSD